MVRFVEDRESLRQLIDLLMNGESDSDTVNADQKNVQLELAG